MVDSKYSIQFLSIFYYFILPSPSNLDVYEEKSNTEL